MTIHHFSHLKSCVLATVALLCAVLSSLGREVSAAEPDALPLQEVQEEATTAKRTLQFPISRSVGRVDVRPATAEPFVHSLYTDDWSAFGEARGPVEVDAGLNVRLDIGSAASTDLSFLDRLQPADVEAINLRDTRLTDEGLKFITRLTGLRGLDLQHTRISDKGAEHLGQLAHLEEICLDAFGVNREGFGVGDGAMKALSQLRTLKCVRLRLTKVTDAGLEELSQCRSLVWLDLAGTEVSDRGLNALKRLPNLIGLRLGVYNEGANVTDEGMTTIGELVQLTSLELSGTKVTERGLSRLDKLVKLEHLSLDNMGIPEAGPANLEPLRSLKQLRLYTKHPTTDIGAAHLARVTSLRRITEHLNLTDKGVRLLAQLPDLEDFELFGRSVTDASAGAIAGMQAVQSLSFQDCAISDATLEAIGELPNLRTLCVVRTNVQRHGFAAFQRTKSLSSLFVDFGNAKFLPAGFQSSVQEICDLKQLEDLRIQGAGITNEQLSGLANLDNLRKLHIDAVPVDDEGITQIARLQGLTTLSIRGGVFTDSGLESLSHLSDLEFVHLGGRFTDHGLTSLVRLKSLRSAYFESADVTDNGLQRLTQTLPRLQTAKNYVPRGR